MLGVSAGMIGSSGDGAVDTHESGGGSSEVGEPNSVSGGGVEESERKGAIGGVGGNRWPREETLALIKIRSEMDAAFRDSTLKGPLWEEVSRKMASLGFQRNAKKCKEKFENVYKYHKRTKDSRAAKSAGKAYRFFDQLAALENFPSNPPRPIPSTAAVSAAATVSSISPTPLTVIHPNAIPINSPHQFQQSQMAAPNVPIPPEILQSDSTSSSTSSDKDIQRRRRGKKRKWKDYFERLMKEAVEKQEALQKNFLETLEKKERDRTAREEAWRLQETARINREHEILVRERSTAAAKDAALIAFLQKVNDQNNLQISFPSINSPPPHSAKPPPPTPPQHSNFPAPPTKVMEASKTDNDGDNYAIPGSLRSISSSSSSRWPKAEVQALIDLRTGLNFKYQSDHGSKGPLWEEISTAMRKMGYSRSAKRCKEKWENMNKYYKKVKESNKKRPEDSKTCPYFHQLEAVYNQSAGFVSNTTPAQPEHQWPLTDGHEQKQQQQQQQQLDCAMQDDQRHQDRNNNDSENNNDQEDDEFDEEEEEEEEDEDEDGGEYELIANGQTSMVQ